MCCPGGREGGTAQDWFVYYFVNNKSYLLYIWVYLIFITVFFFDDLSTFNLFYQIKTKSERLCKDVF